MDSQFVLFFYFSRPPSYPLPKFLKKFWYYASSYSDCAPVGLQWTPSCAGFPWNEFADHWPKWKPPCSLTWFLALFPLFLVVRGGRANPMQFALRVERQHFLFLSKSPVPLVFSKNDFCFFPFTVWTFPLLLQSIDYSSIIFSVLDQLQELFVKIINFLSIV